ncbi:hypothetical protein D3C73_694050 [compost metagenome]
MGRTAAAFGGAFHLSRFAGAGCKLGSFCLKPFMLFPGILKTAVQDCERFTGFFQPCGALLNTFGVAQLSHDRCSGRRFVPFVHRLHGFRFASFSQHLVFVDAALQDTRCCLELTLFGFSGGDFFLQVPQILSGQQYRVLQFIQSFVDCRLGQGCDSLENTHVHFSFVSYIMEFGIVGLGLVVLITFRVTVVVLFRHQDACQNVQEHYSA